MNLYNPNLPPRTDDFLSGSDFMNSIMHLSPQDRNSAFIAEVAKGNVPIWWRNFAPVNIVNGNNKLTMYVSPDMTSIGSDLDYCRIATDGHTARKIADVCGCILPTSKMSYDIWKASDLKVLPIFGPHDATMITPQVFLAHNQQIQEQINGQNFVLLSSVKKDIVIAKHLTQDKTRLGIYGWFDLHGTPVQDLQTVAHQVNYCDYSQSIRLINQTALLNGQEVNLFNILKDPILTRLINYEAAFDAISIYK